MNRAIEEAARRLEGESEELVTYLNDEVVPAIREHSTRGLRSAANKLAMFADYLEKTKKRRS
jgi:hypothetical protein